MSPKFIVVEGGEGSGKSTLVNMVKEHMSSTFVFTREPGGSPYAEQIRNLALKSEYAKEATSETLFALMWAGRHDNIKNIIIPALKGGKNVLCDRFDSSTYAYQIHGMRAKNLEKYFWQTRSIFLKDIKPDLYIILDVNPEEGLKRIANREGSNHFDERSLDFHRRIRRGLVAFKAKIKNCIIIDANRSLDNVSKDFISTIKNFVKNDFLEKFITKKPKGKNRQKAKTKTKSKK